MKKAAFIFALALTMILSSCGQRSTSLDKNSPYLADYDTFWTIVEENYPLYSAAERITGNDLAAVKEDNRSKAAEAKNGEELCQVLVTCEKAFQETGHFYVISNPEEYRFLANTYGRLKDTYPGCAYLYDRMNNPASNSFYQVDLAEELQKIEKDGGDRVGTKSNGNISFRDFPEDQTAYVSIAEMTADYDNNDSEVLNDWFRKLESEEYQNCILDIRGNRGGNSEYWSNYIVLPNLRGTCSYSNYLLVKGQESVGYLEKTGVFPKRIEDGFLPSLPALPQEDLQGITHYVEQRNHWPSRGKPLFTGRFWLLVDDKVYSSSEMLAVFCKTTGFATLVGVPTGGDGIGVDPLITALPNTGICLRFSAVEGLNADGSCNEEVGTQPDILAGQGEDALELCLKTIRPE